jgi:hypothetical protein
MYSDQVKDSWYRNKEYQIMFRKEIYQTVVLVKRSGHMIDDVGYCQRGLEKCLSRDPAQDQPEVPDKA